MIKTIDLRGEYRLHLDPYCGSVPPEKYEDSIILPDTLSHSGKAPYNPKGETGFLTDTHPFEGCGWFSREIDIEEDLGDRNVFLFLERTRVSIVYIDGKEIGSRNSLCAPHRYNVGMWLTRGRHTLTICVQNVNYPTKGGHMTSPDTQTNWLGITGRMELQVFPKAFMSDVRITTLKGGRIRVSGKAAGSPHGVISAEITDPSGKRNSLSEIKYSEGKFSAVIAVKNPLMWDEFSRNIYTLTLIMGEDIYTAPFGLCLFSHNKRKLLVNGEEAFLRGKHDGMIFPLTGFAPCDEKAWTERFEIAKSYGINHYRFHTCCPPEGAFAAADKVGIYLEPELPFWGTIAAKGEEGYSQPEQEYLISEGRRIIAEFSHHPSFVMMSLGNELWGSRQRLGEIIHILREENPSIFFTSGSNNFQFCPEEIPEEDFFVGVRLDRERLFRGSYAACDAPLGHIQTDIPNTSHNYNSVISGRKPVGNSAEGTIQIQYGTGVKTVSAEGAGGYVPQKPVISHEVGQYDFFPDFDEYSLYTGPLQPRYLDVFRETLEKRGLFGQWKDFFYGVGMHCTDCYKREIEAALRTKELSGFQLLDLQDFNGQGVSLVGILNAFMQPKGFISPEKWRGFCSGNVLLAEMDKLVYSAGETLKIRFLLSSYGSGRINGGKMRYRLESPEINKTGEFEITPSKERLTVIGEKKISLSAVTMPQKAVLTLESGEMRNSYDLWLYPENDVIITEKGAVSGEKRLAFARSLDEAKKLIARGERAIVISDGSSSVENTYCADFWNYHMFRVISESMGKPVAPGTMGLLIDTESPLLKGFPCEKYSTPQWFELVMHSHADILDDYPDIIPTVQVVDNTERCHRLGMLYELDGVTVCTVRLWEIGDKAEVKQFVLGLMG